MDYLVQRALIADNGGKGSTNYVHYSNFVPLGARGRSSRWPISQAETILSVQYLTKVILKSYPRLLVKSMESEAFNPALQCS